MLGALDEQTRLQDQTFHYNTLLEQHNIARVVTDQYLTAYQYLLLSRLSEEVVDNLRQQLILSGELVEKGFLSSQDYLLLKIEMESQAIARNEARQQYRSHLYQLNALCGINDTTLVDIAAAGLTPAEAGGPSQFIAKYSLDSLAAAAELSIFEATYQPQVKLFANTGLNAVELNNIQRKFGVSAGLNITLPILDGGQKKLTRQQNHITRSTISAYRQYANRNIAMQRKNLQERIRSMGQNVIAQAKQVNDYRGLLDMSARQLRQGNISMIDYLTLLRNFIELRRNSIDKNISYQMEINQYNYWNW
jgi:outer membrane protein TolC